MMIKNGDVFRHELAGGGGWGDALERDPGHVLRDVRNELVGVEAARESYGVVINSETWTVDAKATEELRAQIREKRGWKENPFVSWDDEGTETALAAAE
jgi:N-methylhydantoinase B